MGDSLAIGKLGSPLKKTVSAQSISPSQRFSFTTSCKISNFFSSLVRSYNMKAYYVRLLLFDNAVEEKDQRPYQ